MFFFSNYAMENADGLTSIGPTPWGWRREDSILESVMYTHMWIDNYLL